MAVSNLILSNLAVNEFQDTNNANAAVVIKAAAGTLYMMLVDNSLNAAVSYVKLYDTAGAVTVGTTIPDWVIKVPASIKTVFAFNTTSASPPTGEAFAAGLQVSTVTTGGTGGVTSPASAVTVVIAYT